MSERYTPLPASEKKKALLTRRALVKGSLGFSGALLLNKNKLHGFSEFSANAQTQADPLSSKNTSIGYEETGKESIDETTEHLFDIYKEKMLEEEGYVDDEYRKRFCQEITLSANRLTPQNLNLANQLAAHILSEISFKTLLYPTSDDKYQKVSPLEQVRRIEEHFTSTNPEKGYWNIADFYKTTTTDQDTIQTSMENAIQKAAEVGENPHFLADPRTQRDGLAINELGEGEKECLQTLVTISKEAYRDHEPLAQLMATQALLESGIIDGGSDLFNIYNNPFGNKGIGTHGAVYLPTKEQDAQGNEYDTWAWFQAHATLEDGFEAHRKLMQWDNYERVWDAATFEEAADFIVNPGEGKSSYATDKAYTKKLIDIYDTYLKPYFEEEDATPESEAPTDIVEKFEAAGADFEKMDELALVAEKEAKRQNRLGWCLNGVQNSLEAIGLVNERQFSAYMMVDVFRQDARFVEIENITNDQIKELPAGAIAVYEGDPTTIADDVTDENGNTTYDHGHIEVSLGDGQFASSYINDGNFHLSSDYYVFAPGVQGETTMSTTLSFGVETTQFFDSEEEYQQAISSSFDLNMDGFDKTRLEWAWKKFNSISKTKFTKLTADTTINAIPGQNSRQIDTHNVNLGKDLLESDFGPLGIHELSHIIYNRYKEILAPLIKEAYEKEGPVTTYGEIGYNKYPNDEVRRYHEDFADTIRNFLNPTYEKSSQDLKSYQPNHLYDPSNPKPLHKKLAEMILLGDLLIKN